MREARRPCRPSLASSAEVVPAALEDAHFREKIFHFDHERIPERVVHARGVSSRSRPASRRSPAGSGRAGARR